jgi:hypothetical protein
VETQGTEGAPGSLQFNYIIQINPTTGTAAQVVGTGVSGYNGNCCDQYGNLMSGTQVQVNGPVGLSVDPDGRFLGQAQSSETQELVQFRLLDMHFRLYESRSAIAGPAALCAEGRGEQLQSGTA